MRRIVRTVFSGSLSLVLMSGTVSTACAQNRLAGWHSDLKTAAAVARRTGKPLFVVFRCVR